MSVERNVEAKVYFVEIDLNGESIMEQHDTLDIYNFYKIMSCSLYFDIVVK